MRDLAERPVTFDYHFTMTCPHCPAVTSLTSTEYHREDNGACVACGGCGGEIHFGPAVMAMRDSGDPALDSDHVLDLAWYHTSVFPDWPVGSRALPEVTMELMRRHGTEDLLQRAGIRHENQALHLGSYEAAVESMLYHMSDRDEGGRNFFLYRVALRSAGVAVEPGWRNENTTEAAQISQDALGEFDAVRYLNVRESPGSVSLAVRPAAIAAIQKIALPVTALSGAVEPELLARIADLRAESERAQALRSLNSGALEQLRRRVAAKLHQSPWRAETLLRSPLPREAGELLEDEYLAGVSQPVRDRFTRALLAWRYAQRTPVSNASYARKFMSMAAVLTQPERVMRLVAAQPSTSMSAG